MTLVELNIGLGWSTSRYGYLRWPQRLSITLKALHTSKHLHNVSVRFRTPKGDEVENVVVVAAMAGQCHLQAIRHELLDLATVLEQDCIAVRFNGVGELVGPGASKWEPFDPSLFITLEDA